MANTNLSVLTLSTLLITISYHSNGMNAVDSLSLNFKYNHGIQQKWISITVNGSQTFEANKPLISQQTDIPQHKIILFTQQISEQNARALDMKAIVSTQCTSGDTIIINPTQNVDGQSRPLITSKNTSDYDGLQLLRFADDSKEHSEAVHKDNKTITITMEHASVYYPFTVSIDESFGSITDRMEKEFGIDGCNGTIQIWETNPYPMLKLILKRYGVHYEKSLLDIGLEPYKGLEFRLVGNSLTVYVQDIIEISVKYSCGQLIKIGLFSSEPIGHYIQWILERNPRIGVDIDGSYYMELWSSNNEMIWKSTDGFEDDEYHDDDEEVMSDLVTESLEHMVLVVWRYDYDEQDTGDVLRIGAFINDADLAEEQTVTVTVYNNCSLEEEVELFEMRIVDLLRDFEKKAFFQFGLDEVDKECIWLLGNYEYVDFYNWSLYDLMKDEDDEIRLISLQDLKLNICWQMQEELTLDEQRQGSDVVMNRLRDSSLHCVAVCAVGISAGLVVSAVVYIVVGCLLSAVVKSLSKNGSVADMI